MLSATQLRVALPRGCTLHCIDSHALMRILIGFAWWRQVSWRRGGACGGGSGRWRGRRRVLSRSGRGLQHAHTSLLEHFSVEQSLANCSERLLRAADWVLNFA
jgi:hypothetical protein